MAEEKTDLYRQGKKTEVERISLLFQTIETLRRKRGGEGKKEKRDRIKNVGSGACLKTIKTAHYVMLNLFQHLMKSMSYETLK